MNVIRVRTRVGSSKHEHSGRYARVGLEHTRRHGDHRVELLFLYERLAELLVGFGCSKQDTIGHDARTPTTWLELLQKQADK